MPLLRLCFVLPTDDDSVVPVEGDEPRRRVTTVRSFLRGKMGAVVSCLRCKSCGCGGRDSSSSSGVVFQDIAGVHDDGVGGGGGGGGGRTRKLASSPRIFSYSELYIGTNGFSDKEVLGSGGFGTVYRALLPSDGTTVAVKCVASRGERFEKSFLAELAAVARLRHRNLVRLRGWCVQQGEKEEERVLMLVYDYMPNRSLDRLLFAKKAPGPVVTLSWDRRRRIVAGLAAALFYLHEQLDTQIIHRDVKTSNVLLDGDMNARLCDFGLARLYDRGVDPQATRVAGTIGYMAPELWITGKATPATDVFAFGVFVLEVCCGRRPHGFVAPDDDRNVLLLDWVREHESQGTTLGAMDPRLGGMYDADEARLVLKVGLMCAHPLADARPGMRKVIKYLNRDVPVPEMASMCTSYTVLALAQNDMSNPVSAVCLSGGR